MGYWTCWNNKVRTSPYPRKSTCMTVKIAFGYILTVQYVYLIGPAWWSADRRQATGWSGAAELRCLHHGVRVLPQVPEPSSTRTLVPDSTRIPGHLQVQTLLRTPQTWPLRVRYCTGLREVRKAPGASKGSKRLRCVPGLQLLYMSMCMISRSALERMNDCKLPDIPYPIYSARHARCHCLEMGFTAQPANGLGFGSSHLREQSFWRCDGPSSQPGCRKLVGDRLSIDDHVARLACL